ncbi:GNAT family N-acetyltransferase [Paenibacillus macquariensis]|nr:GNAT family N-acetyltransferase [Paenibacillus macquariensis]MEC0090647.1 GNAT family N-acetyltransferase [Paenibacillus macquariensis]
MIMNHDLAGILERSEINYMIDRMTAIQEREGNPEGIVINEFGLCTAFYSRRMPWGLFNNVKGLIEEEVLEDVLRFYEERERKFEIQIIPSKVNQDVLKLLSQRGFYQSGFHTTLYCDSLAINSTQKEEIHIRELQEDEFDIYAEIHCLGTGLSLEGKSYVAANNEVLYARRGWKYYIGFYNDIPAAVAVMYMEDNVASLTFATTLPDYRNKGFQTYLLQRRINDAYKNACKLVVSQTSYCSSSHRNMERVGMKIGYTRSTWIRA